MNKIEFTKPYIDDDIINSVVDCLKSGWITTGPKVIELEKKICELFNINKCLCLNSWTNCAKSILEWYGIGEGDEVIVPVITYCATANIVLHCGAKVIMIDVNNKMNIDVTKIREKITENTKVIIPVDIGGISCDYKEIKDIVEDNDIKKMFKPKNKNQEKLGRILLLSDAAHSIGSMYRNGYACNYSDFTVFSFHAVKNITSGEGGAICFNLPHMFNIEEEYKHIKIYTLHGQTKSALDKYSDKSSNDNYWKYDVLIPGYKYNMPDILACIALEQLKKFNYLMNTRRQICIDYHNELSKHKFINCIHNMDDIRHSSCHLFCIRLLGMDSEKRDEFINKVNKYEIKLNVHFQPLPMLTLYKNLKYNINDYQNSHKIYQNVISLPLHYYLNINNIKYISNIIHKVYNEQSVKILLGKPE
jgi:dTDP-4-amino-4,6-dideoxygalactose transaminase